MTESGQTTLVLVSKRAGGGDDPKSDRDIDPVAKYLRFRVARVVGDEPGQMAANVAAERIGVSAGALSMFLSGQIGLRKSRYAGYAKFLGYRGTPTDAAERLVSDAAEWYRSLIGGSMPLLEEPAVRQAIEIVAQAERVSPKLVEGLLAAFSHSTFLGRDTAYWTRILADELRYDAARRESA